MAHEKIAFNKSFESPFGGSSDVIFDLARNEDVSALAALHTAVANDLTNKYGRGHWSSQTTDSGMLHAMKTSKVFVARAGSELVGTLRLTTKKPWAIETSYFSPSRRPLYLIGMAVAPAWQRKGIGRQCLEQALREARAWPADAIRFDAYDADAGAGAFYARCGCKEMGRVVYRGTPLIYFEILC